MSPVPSIRPGLCSITLRDLPWQEVADLAAEVGLEGVEWGADVHVPPGDLERAAAVAGRSVELDLACPSYGSYLRAGDPAPTGPAVEAVLDTALALGAPNVRVWTRWLAVADATGADRRAVAVDLAAWCRAAEERELTLSLEHHRWTLTETIPSTLALLEAVDAPNLFTYWQPDDGVAVPQLLDDVEAVRSWLSHLHVFRWRSFEDRQPLAEGADLWPDVFALVDGGASGDRWLGPRWAFLEYVAGDEPDQVRADAEVLRAWIDR